MTGATLPLFPHPSRMPKPAQLARRGQRTSVAAAESIDASGELDGQRGAVLDAVRATPGLTRRRLAGRHGLELQMVGRRLSDLERAGLIRKGEAKPEANGRRAATWWPVSAPVTDGAAA